MKVRIIAGILLLFSSVLILHAMKNTSPTWDEIVFPASGYAQLKTGELRLNTVNPFLSKCIFALPLFLINPSVPLSHPSWENKDDYRFGFEFIYRNEVSPHTLIFLSRLPLLGFFILTAFLMYKWLRKVWGEIPGIISLVCFMTTPIFLSRGVVAQAEMPVLFLILVSLWLHYEWFRTNNINYLYATGIGMGLAALGKLIALPLIPTFIILNLFFHPKKHPLVMRIFFGLVPTLIGVFVVIIGYLPWKGGWEALTQMTKNLIIFDKIIPFYWAGQIKSDTPSLISWAAFLIKSPLHVILLSGIGIVVFIRNRKRDILFWHFAFLAISGLLTVLFFKNAVSTIQLSPVYLGLCGLAGYSHTKNIKTPVLVALLVVGALDVYSVHPNYLAYFNRTVGGSNQGYKWLWDSDQDWGQSLPALANAMKKKKGHLILCFSGSGDPDAYGLKYHDLFSPALVTKSRVDKPIPDDDDDVYLAVGTKVIQSEPVFAWMGKEFNPDEIVGQSFFLTNMTHRPELLNWVGEIYKQTKRPNHAKPLFKKAFRLMSTQVQ